MSYVAIIEAGGKRYEGLSGPDEGILGGIVELTEGKTASAAQVTIADPQLAFANTVDVPHKNQRVPFEVWFGEYPAPPKVFSGWISSMSCSLRSATTTILATDKSKRARKRSKARTKTNANAAALVKTIAAENGLEVELSKAALSEITLSQAIQMGETDWEYLVRILETAGHRVKVRGNTAYVTQVGVPRSGLAAANLEYGVNIRDGNISMRERSTRTTSNIYDVAGELVAETGDEDLDEVARKVARLERVGLVVTADEFPSFTDESLQKVLKLQAKAKKRKIFEFDVDTTVPLPGVDTDDFVTVRGLGTRFSGLWFVDKVRHDLVQLTTSLTLYNGGAG